MCKASEQFKHQKERVKVGATDKGDFKGALIVVKLFSIRTGSKGFSEETTALREIF